MLEIPQTLITLPVGQIEIGLFFLQVLLLISSVFLILLILVQRGKGGGLTGALGGMGGQSAFGSKAGDAFTKITVVTALVWITLCMVTIARYNPPPAGNAQNQQQGAVMTGGSQVDTDAAMSSDGEGSGTTDIKTDGADADVSGSTDGASADTSQDIELDLDAPVESTETPDVLDAGESTDSE